MAKNMKNYPGGKEFKLSTKYVHFTLYTCNFHATNIRVLLKHSTSL